MPFPSAGSWLCPAGFAHLRGSRQGWCLHDGGEREERVWMNLTLYSAFSSGPLDLHPRR